VVELSAPVKAATLEAVGLVESVLEELLSHDTADERKESPS
jgi:hypothetical protein